MCTSKQADGQLYEAASNQPDIAVNYNLLRDSSYDMATIDHKRILKMTDPRPVTRKKLRNRHGSDWSIYRLTLYEEMLGERIEMGSQTYYLSVEKPPGVEQ